jgi:integrase
MVKLRQDNKGNYSARKRLPDDVRAEYGRLYGAHHEAKFSAPSSVGSEVARQRFREWDAEVTGRIAAIRAAQRGEGIELTHKDAVALAGEWYNWFVAQHEPNPGKPEHWDIGLYLILDKLLDYAPHEVRAEPIRDLEWTRDPEVRGGVRPVLADWGRTSQFLAQRGIALTNSARTLFLDCVLDNYIAALSLLEQRAKGDYSPDDLPKTFPGFLSNGPSAAGLTPLELFEGWLKARSPQQSTIESWRPVFNALTRDFPHRSASSLTSAEAQKWLDDLITRERSAFTVRNTWLRATRAVYAWGAKRKLTRNPFAEATVEVPRKRKMRPKWFYEHEWKTILRAAAAIKDTSTFSTAIYRWVPWLMAYTGARAQEITQLRGSDVQQLDNIWTLNLTPEAGTTKTGEARRVPIHEHLIDQGFLAFVTSRGTGPLFYRQRKEHNSEPTKQKKLPGAQARQRLATWVRSLGVNDANLSPNHAWRHTFKLIAERSGISERIHDAITGHAPRTVGRTYGQATSEDMAHALKKFPRYEI